MGGASSTHNNDENTLYKILIGTSEENKPRERRRCRLEDNIKIELKNK
jgi:hypothetical protein